MSYDRLSNVRNEPAISIIEIKQIRQLVLQDYSSRLLKNDLQRLRQQINNKFSVSIKNIIRSSLSNDKVFINFNTYQDCLFCYNNRYSLDKGIFLKLPNKPIFTSEHNNFSILVSNSNIKNKILFYNELREYLPEGITNIDHLGKTGKFVVSFEEVKIYKICLKILVDKSIRLCNGSVISTTKLKKGASSSHNSNGVPKAPINIIHKGKRMSHLDKIKKNKHYNFNESDSRSILTFKLLNNIKILNQDKKLKYRLLKKNKRSLKPNIYSSPNAVESKPKNFNKRIIPANIERTKQKTKLLLKSNKDINWNVSL